MRSERLKTLLTTRADTDDGEDQGGLLPGDVEDIIDEFDQLIVWKKVAGGANAVEVPEPQKGIDEDFDEANAQVDAIKEELNDFLNGMRQRFKERRINFSHAKHRYELEIPEEHVKGTKKPKDLEFSSSKAGYQRFLTNESRELVDRLEVAEDKLKDAMAPFLTAIFSKFHSKKSMWLQVLAILSELDCLAALSIVSGHSDVPQCRPVFRKDKEGEETLPAYMQLKKMVHPCVTLTGK